MMLATRIPVSQRIWTPGPYPLAACSYTVRDCSTFFSASILQAKNVVYDANLHSNYKLHRGSE